MKRTYIIPFISLVCLAFTACGGGSDDPPLPQAELTPEIEEADKQLTLAIDKCTGRVIGWVQRGSQQGSAQPQSSFNESTTCYDDFIVALLLWKSAPKRDNTLAINDEAYRNYLYLRLRNHVNRLGSSLSPSYQQVLAASFVNSYNSYFLPRLSGQLSPQEVAVLQSAVTF